jgi:2'-5' RNA ligase
MEPLRIPAKKLFRFYTWTGQILPMLLMAKVKQDCQGRRIMGTYPALVRTFVALPISAAQTEALEKWLNQGPWRHRGVAWNKPEQWHFTLAFLGEIPEISVNWVISAARTVAAATPPFSFCLGEPGVFPPRGPARVLWLGMSQGAPALTSLQGRLAERLHEAGLTQEEREFTPHLTLGRVKPGAVIQREQWLAPEGAGWQNLEGFAREIKVMRSDLQPGGARHTVLAACALGTAIT